MERCDWSLRFGKICADWNILENIQMRLWSEGETSRVFPCRDAVRDPAWVLSTRVLNPGVVVEDCVSYLHLFACFQGKVICGQHRFERTLE